MANEEAKHERETPISDPNDQRAPQTPSLTPDTAAAETMSPGRRSTSRKGSRLWVQAPEAKRDRGEPNPEARTSADATRRLRP